MLRGNVADAQEVFYKLKLARSRAHERKCGMKQTAQKERKGETLWNTEHFLIF